MKKLLIVSLAIVAGFTGGLLITSALAKSANTAEVRPYEVPEFV